MDMIIILLNISVNCPICPICDWMSDKKMSLSGSSAVCDLLTYTWMSNLVLYYIDGCFERVNSEFLTIIFRLRYITSFPARVPSDLLTSFSPPSLPPSLPLSPYSLVMGMPPDLPAPPLSRVMTTLIGNPNEVL